MPVEATEKPRSGLDTFAATREPSGTENALVPSLSPATLAVLNRSEIDAQFAQAESHARNLKLARATARDLATLNEKTAQDCIYVIPRDGKEIEGPSVRFAEILASAFGHARIGARVIEETHDRVTAQGIFNDLQTNVVTTFEVQRRIVGRNGRRYSLDMIATTANAACAIARRNAILQGIPRPLWSDIFEEVQRLAKGGVNARNRDVRADDALKAFAKLGVKPEQIYEKVGVTGFDGLGLDELHRLRGYYNAIVDGEATVEEIFPEPRKHDKSLDTFASAAPGVPDAKPAEPAADHSPASPAVGISPENLAKMYAMCIEKVLGAANDKKLLPEPEDRVANLKGPVAEIWGAQPIDQAFVANAIETGIKVARSQLVTSVAKKYLEGIIPS